MNVIEWAKRLVKGEPHFIIYTNIGGMEVPQLKRWWLIPRNRFFNIYLHHIVQSDRDRVLHDHPWHSVSIVLKGRLAETVQASTPLYKNRGFCRNRYYRAGNVVFRRAEFAHRLWLQKHQTAWTLFLTGPVIREWGFLCPGGWKQWRKYVSEHPGKARGCGGD